MDRIKVVWICHFSNDEINRILKPRKYVAEFAPWISNSLKMMEGDDRFELYVISPFRNICGIKKFNLRGINYIFFNAHMPFIGRNWPRFFRWDYWTKFFTTKLIVKGLVNQIKPDIIHLQTAENGYISSTILPLIDKYPTILTVQGFINQCSDKSSYITQYRCNIEKEIFSKLRYSFYRTEQMDIDIRQMNPKIKTFFNTYPNKYKEQVASVKEVEKEYDVVFFARISREKGIVDLIDAAEILVKNGMSDLKVCVIGGGGEEFKSMILERGLENNFVWKGFMPTQQDVFQEVKKAKISVLPTHFDVIPGTIIESMFMGLPVVTYNVGGIPEINKTGNYISIVDKSNIEQLAFEIKRLLCDEDLHREKSEGVKYRAEEMFCMSNKTLRQQLFNAYQYVINNY